MQVYLTPADRTLSANVAQAASASAEQDLLVVSGDIDATGAVHLNPLKSTLGTPRAPEPGPYRLRITLDSGAVIEQVFASRELDHRSDHQHFGFSIAHPGAIERVEVLRGAQVVHQRAARARALGSGPASVVGVQASEQGGALRLSWDSAQHPYLTVTHVGNARTVVGLDLQGGSTTLPIAALPPGGRFEFGLSDGLNTRRVLAPR
jgi:hypothetical protein